MACGRQGRLTGVRLRRQKAAEAHRQRARASAGAVGQQDPASSPASTAVLSELAGFRVGRRLGIDADAELYLGHSIDVARESAGPQKVTLKLFRAGAASSQMERELAARSQLPSGLMAEVIDASTLADGRIALVLEHLAGGSLLRHLRDNAPFSPGEAVTILAPVLCSLTALHDAGFALPDLSVASIALTAAGRPAIDQLGLLQDIPSAAADPQLRRDLLRSDYDRYIRLMREVFATLEPSDSRSRHAEGIVGWGEEAADHLPIADCLTELERALFDWAPAQALRMHSHGVAPDLQRTHLPLRRVELTSAGPAIETDGAIEAVKSDRRPLSERVRRFVGRVHRPAPARDRPSGSSLASLRKRLSSRPVVVGVALAIGLIALSLTALSNTEGADDASALGSATTTPLPTPPGDQPGTGSEHAAIMSDDPVAAATALLSLRADCLASSSVLCLDSVNQSGSAAMAADRYTVRMAQQNENGPTPPRFGAATTLVERNGDSALVVIETVSADQAEPVTTTNKPASLLMIRGEAGWRVREIFDY